MKLRRLIFFHIHSDFFIVQACKIFCFAFFMLILYYNCKVVTFLPLPPKVYSYSSLPLCKFIFYLFYFTYMHICDIPHIYIYLKTDKLFPYNVTSTYIFRADHLSLDSQLVCSYMRRTSSSNPSFAQLSIIRCVRTRRHGLFHMQFGIFLSVLVQFMF